jgi:ubiquinone/menaquinone biosynthesis C-methylase UbiE
MTQTSAGVRCRDCGRTLPVDQGLIVVREEHSGNNRIAAEFYDSPRWDKYRFWKRFTPFNDRAVTRWSEEVFAHLPRLANTRLLDVAIGDGRNMSWVPESCEVHGIDISAAQLRSCLRQYGERKLFLFQGEAESLPWKDNTFDHALSFGAFNYFNNPLAALQEMARVVKPEGLIVVTDEYADLPDRMIGTRLGWPALDRWIMSSVLHLGSEFTAMIEQHRDLEIQPIVDQVLTDWQISEVCDGWAYCFVGHA